jgi:hypothetical protein
VGTGAYPPHHESGLIGVNGGDGMASGGIRFVKPVVILSYSAVPYDSHKPSWLSILAEVEVGESRSGTLVLKGHSLIPNGCVYQISLRLFQVEELFAYRYTTLLRLHGGND